jgi:hypothetical protein
MTDFEHILAYIVREAPQAIFWVLLVCVPIMLVEEGYYDKQSRDDFKDIEKKGKRK